MFAFENGIFYSVLKESGFILKPLDPVVNEFRNYETKLV
tara:strand:- start:558 stop:674 length:117 start_codon:yes stop_codon:yes gene_type:complete